MASILAKPRVISFTKNERAITGNVYAIPLVDKFVARIIIFPNKGEPPELYGRLINDLCTKGYDVMFYNRVKTYIDVVDASKEFNRAVKLSVNDIDSIDENRLNHKIHVIGQFLAGSETLFGGIESYYKNRIKSIISINPVLNTFSQGTLKWVVSRVQLTDYITTDFYLEEMTRDDDAFRFLRENKPDYRKIQAYHYRALDQIIKNLRHKKTPMKFAVKNLLVIHSDENAYKSDELIQSFTNNVNIESVQVLNYKKGKTELIIETEDIYTKLANDIFQWLEEH